MGTVLTQNNFTAGEITPSLGGQVDLASYRTGVARGLNWLVNYHGGLFNRPGTKFVDPAKFTDKETILIPFQFSVEQTYMLEVGDLYIRFISNGGYLFDGPAKVEVATPYLASEVAKLGFTQSADVLTLFHRNHPIAEVRRFSNTDWRFEDFINTGGPFEALNLNDANTIYSSGQSGTVTLTSNFDVFNDNQIGKLIKLDQQTSGEVTSWVQRQEVQVGDKTYNAGAYYEATQADPIGTTMAQTGDIPPTHLEGEIWDGPNENLPGDNRDAIIGVKWRYLHSGFGIARIDSITDARNAIATVVTTIPESIVGGTTPATDWDFPGQTTNKIYVLAPAPTSNIVSDFTVKLLATTGSLGTNVPEETLLYPSQWTINFGTNTVTLAEEPKTPDPDGGSDLPRDVKITQKGSVRETYKWAFEPWRDDSGYPQCGAYYQQRIVTASTRELPQTLWLSRVDSFPDFSQSRPLLADDSMRFDVNSQQVNEIHNMVPLDGLLVLTRGGVFAINRGSDTAITPETPPSVPLQTYDGAEQIRPIATASTVLYVEEGGQIVRDLEYQFGSNSFQGSDLTVRASHLFEFRKIVTWAYAKKPHKVIWVVFDDGTMAALTFLKEQQVWGWTPQETNGLAKWVETVPENGQDAIYFVIERNGQRYVERLEERRHEDFRDSFFVDSGLTYDGRNKTDTQMKVTADSYTYPDAGVATTDADYFDAGMVGRTLQFWNKREETDSAGVIVELMDYHTAIITGFTDARNVDIQFLVAFPESLQDAFTKDWGLTAVTVSGLDHLEGETVSVLADGSVVDQEVVSGGSITLQSPATVIHAGLGYQSVGQTLDVELAPPPETYRNKRKVINKLLMVVRDTNGMKAGTRLDRLEILKARTDDDFYGSPPAKKNGIIEIDTTGEWNRPGRVYFVQDSPLPAEVLSVNPEFAVSETN